MTPTDSHEMGLKPCPFCGGTYILVHERTCDQDTPYNPNDRAAPTVRCGHCFASVFGQNWTGSDTAITAWNTRPREDAAVVDEWRPIETAPRDGTRIIIGRPDSDGDGGISVCGYWLDELEDGVDYMGNDGGFTDVDYQVFYPSRSMGAKLSRYAGRQPTHWRPLPQPPALAAAVGRG